MSLVELGAFYLSKYEMTQAQWQRVTGANPSKYEAGERHGDHWVTWINPVTNIDWRSCVGVLSQLGLELPTEAQWEYAARAGGHTIWPYGNSVADLQERANVADSTVRRFAPGWRYDSELNDGHMVHAPVGSFLPNRWGLHDIVGNVSEWCRDEHSSYRTKPRTGDGLRRHSRSTGRVTRGGSFVYRATLGRSSQRGRRGPGYLDGGLGLRPALSAGGLRGSNK